MPEIASKIVHLLIQPQLTRTEIERACESAAAHPICAVLLQPYYIETARRRLKETHVKIIALIGASHGGTTTATKMFETQDAIQRGADEIAMVINYSALRDREDLVVQNDIGSVVQTARGRPVTVVLENFLSVEEKTRACKIAEKARSAFVQTSLGGTDNEMTLANVKVMSVAAKIPIIASGKIGTADHAAALLDAGAARLATTKAQTLLS